MADIAGFNIGAPYSEIKLYVGRANKGFILKPRTDDYPDGWGEPLEDQNGQSIIPGTPDGSHPLKFIGRRGTQDWGCRHKPGNQLYGNVSWLGPRKSLTVATKGKFVLTFHGPNTRYFPTDAFTYGTDETHNNIYSEGMCIAVAPHPVLGAALRITTEPDGTKKFKLAVICYNGGEDVAMMRDIDPSVGATVDTYNDDFRQECMKLHDPIHNPSGWRHLGYFKCDRSSQGTSRVVKGPRTPWFFDETGTVAQCMREADITFNRGDKSVTQGGYVRYKLTVSDGAASLDVPDNTQGYTFVTTHKVTKHDDWAVACRYPYNSAMPVMTHWWSQHSIEVTINGTGKYAVAVDYADGQEQVFYVEMKTRRKYVEWLYHGIDYQYDPSRHVLLSNDGDASGDLTPTLDPNYQSAQGDGITSMWTSIDDTHAAVCKGFDNFYLYRRLSGSKYEFDTGNPSTADDYLYFCFDYVAYPHYYSIPRPHIAFATDEDMYQYQDNFPSKTEQYNKGTSTINKSKVFMQKDEDMVPGSTSGYIGINVGWLWQHLKLYWEAGLNTTHTFTSIDGLFPFDYPWDVTIEPPVDGWHFNNYLSFEGKWPTLYSNLQSLANNYRVGQLAEDTLDNFAISIKYLDENDDEKYYNALNSDTGRLSALTSTGGATLRFYPLGEL